MIVDPQLDLVLERYIDVPRAMVWKAWTEPEHVKKWFTPRPWSTPECEIDLRPGGIFRVVMESPKGERMPAVSCYLEIVPQERLTWTCALAPGFRPLGKADLMFTAIITMQSQGQGTQYRTHLMHATPEMKTHHEGGFHDGWGTALNQLVEMAKGM